MKTFKFPSSGVTVEIHPVSLVIIQDITREVDAELPRPAPRLERFETFEGSKQFVEERNYSDPDYKAELEAWETRRTALTEAQSFDVLIQMGVKADPIDHQSVNRIRDYYKRYRKTELPSDDNYVYVKYCLVNTVEDYKLLIEAIQNYSHATEEGVSRALTSFQPPR